MVAERNRADRFIQEWNIHHDQGERNKRTLQEELWRGQSEDGIVDVRHRALLAAGESRDFVQAVRREGAMITQEHADLQRDIALEKDPDKRHQLELKRDIQHADYMALANERVAAMSNLNGEQYKEAQRQQEIWEKAGTELRAERLALRERMADQEMINIERDVARRVNEADRQRSAFRADVRGAPLDAEAEVTGRRQAAETAREPVQTHEATAAASMPGQPGTRTTEAERPAEVIYSSPDRPQQQAEASTRENTDARQAESSTAEHAEITDSKAAKKAALAANRAETEQSIAQGQERGFGHSR
jgi:hypothetical protein